MTVLYIYICIYTCIYRRKMATSVCLLQRKFVFLGQQTINCNQRLLSQQTCPSMMKGGLASPRRPVAGQSISQDSTHLQHSSASVPSYGNHSKAVLDLPASARSCPAVWLRLWRMRRGISGPGHHFMD
jgi:hypothetical protein